MANFNSDHINELNAPSFGQPLVNRIPTNLLGGRIRLMEMNFTAPISGTTPAIADKIIWGKLPVKARILAALSRLSFSTGTASSTLNVGDQFLATRYLAATSVNVAAGAALSEPTLTSLADNAVGSAVLTNVKALGIFRYGALVTGTGIQAGSTVLSVDVAGRSVVLSLPCTSANTQTAITATGTPFGMTYETQDDSSNAANAYASPTDDCTISGPKWPST